MESNLIAACGMNCGICYAHLREKNKCPGCRYFDAKEPVSIARCKIRNCDFHKSNRNSFCFECKDYPCKRLKDLDRRYRKKYNMSEIENLETIRNKGINKFIEVEKKKWSCIHCGGIINVHYKTCSQCGSSY
jgi:hypothetical protein